MVPLRPRRFVSRTIQAAIVYLACAATPPSIALAGPDDTTMDWALTVALGTEYGDSNEIVFRCLYTHVAPGTGRAQLRDLLMNYRVDP